MLWSAPPLSGNGFPLHDIDKHDLPGFAAVMIKAFIFDLDGTLIDTEALYVEAAQLVLRDKNLYLSHADIISIFYGKDWCVQASKCAIPWCISYHRINGKATA